ncbi:peroxidasin homolog isoform X3 [Acyrthosiphon pisum]|uniref:Ig-like domain-containing protein n=1 Tax=Acyrthosiphon pisum TaxID=7029 RepID=A0A8R2D5N9_ACYPI|nr:peroxidasin homolog isoform X3 [Acyrthosiphon pisum]|eukprot:XP_016661832.1 PREDICTED: peroxidasin homolog isoform X3 [Acyrthosiphon pisum]
MTRSMHQDDAAAAVLRRIMELLLLLLMFSLSSFASVTVECPDECTCDQELFNCDSKYLGRIPDRISPATTKLELSFNKIRDIEPKSLTHLTELETLILSHNIIREMKNGAFANLSKLRLLYLDANEIENIENGVFNNLTTLEKLYLNYNKIHKLDSDIFIGLTKLKTLYLSYNKIRDIVPKLLSNLTELKVLSLSNNKISDVKIGAFTNLSNLRTLSLNENKIENLETGVFNNLTSLENLYLDYNRIHYLDSEMFKGLTKLNELHLHNNMIRNIPRGIFDSLTSLGNLTLRNVPLTCDCNILWFVNVLKKSYPPRNQIGYYDPKWGPTCHFPVEMSGKSLMEMNENDFHCASPDVIVVPENKTMSVGERLQLSCKAVGDPEPSITWAKDDIDLQLDQRVQVFKNNTLIISKVERTDGGQYKCVVTNSLGRKSFKAMVNVNGLAKNSCDTMFGVLPYFFIIIIIILANCILYNDIIL